ncbi:unnamed protein product [Heterobilharzia americana]|nr:unnamed protein product [Heterobilharzia americana]
MNHVNYHSYRCRSTRNMNTRNLPLTSNILLGFMKSPDRYLSNGLEYMSQDLHFLYRNSNDERISKKVRKGIISMCRTTHGNYKCTRFRTDKPAPKNASNTANKQSGKNQETARKQESRAISAEENQPPHETNT